jgi:penicillin amidase
VPRPLPFLPALVVACLLAVVPAASARDTARYVLPPGNYGGFPQTNENSFDQLPLYDGLTPLRGDVSRADLDRLFLPMNFRPVGSTRVEDTPRNDVRVVYDRYGIPHIDSRTRSGAFYAMGWVLARDRELLLSLGRFPARAAILDIPGVDAFSLVTSATPFEPSAQAEAMVTRQRRLLLRAYGREGRQILRDLTASASGVNAYLRAAGRPPEKPFDANDIIAVTAFIGSIFGAGGGAEHENADLLAKLRQGLGGERGSAAWNDAMQSDDPEAPTTTRRRFSYPPLTGGRVRGSVVVDPGSVELANSRGEAARRRMSNWLLVGPGRSATGNPLAVQGPQLGYYYPEIVYQIDVKAPGIRSQGIGAVGIPYMLIGRTQNYAWSLTSAGHDNRDVFAERLCEPNGAQPTRSSRHYMFRGRCRPMRTFDAGRLGGRPISFQETVHGPVIGTATAGGQPYALARKRSTRGREALNLGALKAMMEGRASTPERFRRYANRFGFTFNWGYVSRRATAFFSSGLLPKRARGLDRRLPTLGTGSYEWRGWLGRRAHPFDVGGPRDLLLNWNNKAAPGFMHGDDEHLGSVHGVEMFDHWPRRPRLENVVSVMNRAATEDLRGSRVWPLVRAALNRGTAPDERTARAAQILDEWVRLGATFVDADRNGFVDHPGEAIMDRAWPRLADAVMAPVYGSRLDDVAEVIGRGPSWAGLVDKDLRRLLGQRVRGPLRLRYCGGGDLARCSSSLWAALKTAVDELAAQQGGDPAAWRRSTPMTSFVPGLIPNRFHQTNRPTYQHVIEFERPRRR